MSVVGKLTPNGRAKVKPAVDDSPVPERVLRELTEVFKSLADRSRLRILFMLVNEGELNVTTIGDRLGQSQPAVSHHLTQLKKAGLIDYRRDGKFNFYRIDPEGLGPLVKDMFPEEGASPRLSFGGLDVLFKKS
jgi:ArsR family transcriptional regulator